MKNLIPQRCRQAVIRHFGEAKLVKLPDGRHELIGGTDADCRDALLWASLFAHGITFGPAKTGPARSAGPARTNRRRPPTGGARAGFAVFSASALA